MLQKKIERCADWTQSTLWVHLWLFWSSLKAIVGPFPRGSQDAALALVLNQSLNSMPLKACSWNEHLLENRSWMESKGLRLDPRLVSFLEKGSSVWNTLPIKTRKKRILIIIIIRLLGLTLELSQSLFLIHFIITGRQATLFSRNLENCHVQSRCTLLI